MTIVMSEIMWSWCQINVSSDNKLLRGLLIKLVKNIASPDELHSLNMDKEDFLSILDWIKSCAEKSRKVTSKRKYFLESKESVKNELKLRLKGN